MSISSLINSSRLARARKISDKNLLEFKIVKTEPLVTYALIRGSSKEPYTCILDLELSIIGHSCPDYNKRGEWCKHIGKLLLKLDDKYHHTILNEFRQLRSIHNERELKEKVDGYKTQELVSSKREKTSEEEVNDEEYSLFELIGISENILSANKIPKIIRHRIKDSLMKELETLEPYFCLIRLNSLVYHIKYENLDDILDIFRDEFETIFKKSLKSIYSVFWGKSIIWRYEIAYLVKNINRRYKIGFHLDLLQISEDLDNNDQIDGKLVIDFMLENSQEDFKEKFSFDIDEDQLVKRLERHRHHFNIKGSNFQEIKAWITKTQSIYQGPVSASKYFDQFAIYLLKLLGENHQLKISFNRSRSIFHLSTKLLETNVGLRYIIERVKESERDYITYDEYKNHITLFDYLSGKDIKTFFREQIKQFSNEFSLPDDGIIVQWDISGSVRSNNKLQAFDGVIKLIPDSTVVLTSQIQPFDVTICSKNTKRIDDFTYSVIPIAIVSTHQIVNYLQKGTQIVSNLLHWNILAKFYETGKLSSGDLNPAIEKTREYYFVFGAQDLEKKLLKLLNYGKKGISDSKYKLIHTELVKDTGLLNSKSRPLLKQFILSEGKSFSNILQQYNKSDVNQMKFILTILRISDNITKFRENFIQAFTMWIFNNSSKNLNTELLNFIGKSDLHPYEDIRVKVYTVFETDYQKLKNEMSQNTFSTRNQIRKNVIGNIIMDELNISKTGKLQSNEIDAIKVKLRSIDRIIS